MWGRFGKKDGVPELVSSRGCKDLQANTCIEEMKLICCASNAVRKQ